MCALTGEYQKPVSRDSHYISEIMLEQLCPNSDHAVCMMRTNVKDI